MRFTNEYEFLSNFSGVTVEFDGAWYPSVESAYQAAKTLDGKERKLVAEMSTPGRAKRAGRKVTLRPDWEDVKLSVMRELLEQKFSQPDLAKRLKKVEGPIVEDNFWGDTFWGVCAGVGENHLGKLLEEIREKLRDK